MSHSSTRPQVLHNKCVKPAASLTISQCVQELHLQTRILTIGLGSGVVAFFFAIGLILLDLKFCDLEAAVRRTEISNSDEAASRAYSFVKNSLGFIYISPLLHKVSHSTFAVTDFDGFFMTYRSLQPGSLQVLKADIAGEHLVSKVFLLGLPMLKYFRSVLFDGQPVCFSALDASDAVCVFAPCVHPRYWDTHRAGAPIGALLLSDSLFSHREAVGYRAPQSAKRPSESRSHLYASGFVGRESSHYDDLSNPRLLQLVDVLIALFYLQYPAAKRHPVRCHRIFILKDLIQTSTVRAISNRQLQGFGHLPQKTVGVLIFGLGIVEQQHHLFSWEVPQRPTRAPRRGDATGESDDNPTHSSPLSSPYGLAALPLSSWVWDGTPIQPWRSCPVRGEFSCRQPRVCEPLAVHSADEGIQPRQRVILHLAIVQAEGDFIDVPSKMFGRDVMPSSDHAPLEDGPDRFDGVRVDAAFGVLAFAVVDAAMVEPKAVQPVVALRLIRADQRTGLHMSVDGPMQRPCVRRVDNHCASLAAALTEAQNGNLADATASRVQLLVSVFVLLQTADKALIHFDDSREPIALASLPGASLTETAKHEPCRLLRDADLLRHLHRTDSLPRRHYEVHCVNPLVKRNMRPLENRCRANREIKFALVTAVEAEPLASRDPLAGNAGRANGAIWPQQRLKIDPRRFLVGDEFEQLKRADRRFAHVFDSS